MSQQAPAAVSGVAHDLEREVLHDRLPDAILASPRTYRSSEHVLAHEHTRAQLLYALTGVVVVSTPLGRWMLPPEHALWIPAGTRHAVDIIGNCKMYSVYVRPDALCDLPVHLHVTGLTPLMRSLIEAADALKLEAGVDGRAGAIMNCLLHEIPHLPERPLNLPLPTHPRIAPQCRAFIEKPTPHLPIDAWAAAAGMSRRTFTRIFRRQTGLSLSTWRRQACLMAALPRLAAGEPVTAVALDLGYDSVPAFTTMFSRMLGMSPKAYLQSISRR